jgi:hypothetical protein
MVFYKHIGEYPGITKISEKTEDVMKVWYAASSDAEKPCFNTPKP